MNVNKEKLKKKLDKKKMNPSPKFSGVVISRPFTGKIPDWCGTMKQFKGYGSKYKYSLEVDGKRVPIWWKEA